MSPLLKLHVASASIALLTITTFWTSTLVSELFFDHAAIAATKQSILWGMALLIPMMALAGATGSKLGKGWKLPEVARKMRRMKLIAANGMLVLLPSAIFLAVRASADQLDMLFYSVQGMELLAGGTNITLLVLNLKDGQSLRNRRLRRAAQ
ncbi:hypothetical protein Q4525_06335 [Shimia thalassica]|uniref:hypothetical protein n=1 Tax=Shimia thalassica TaxID=1715693 RepID=UPI001C0A0276|nr:hypothetical protein [Shimia thalassica]MBU2943139.1 hypothetical protein [Shimia thalassica]MDO6482038.1 hypothetical protein [Shimia thalassica]MDO6502538.1 hypothetical protein [Shimia thalassica]